MGEEGLEPSEAEANCFTDSTAANYGILAQKIGRVRVELTMFTTRVTVLQTARFSLLHTCR